MSEALTEIYDRHVAGAALRADAAQRAILPRLDELRGWLEAGSGRESAGFWSGLFGKTRAAPGNAPKGVYLWGGVGRGKSMIMDLFFAAVDIPDKRRVHFHAFMQEVHAALNAERKKGSSDVLRPVGQAMAQDLRLLAFDEMQVSDIADAAIVGRLFTVLFEEGVVIVTTSNRPPRDLYKDGLNRHLFLPFIGLLEEKLDIIELETETDYRRHRLAGEQVYFSPADTAAKDRIDRIWAELTGQDSAPLTLRVQGRDVVLPAFHNGVARAQFWDLCGKALGPADYLAIARVVRVLVLEDIPCLSRSNFNEAKRFVTLVDALYEGRVRLIASAADVPERLYLEGEGTFEFARTASRLHEMQSAGWGEMD
jgi:cell division protein ZapE